MALELGKKSLSMAKSLGGAAKSFIDWNWDLNKKTPEKVLGQIYDLMLKVQEEQDIDHELSMRDEKKREKGESDRNAALIKALTARKKPKAKRPPKKKEEAKKEEKPPTKPAEKKPPEKKVEEKKPETKKTEEKVKKDEAVKKQVDKESEKAKQQAQKEADKAKKTAEKEQASAKKKVEEETKPKAEPVKPPEVKPPKTEPVTKASEVKPPTTTKLPAAAAGVAAAMSLTDVQAMIMEHEGKVNYPYKDSKGLWTIGVGHLIGDGKTLPPEYAAWKNNGGPYDKKNNKTPALTDKQVQELFEKDFEEHRKKASKSPGWDLANETGKAAMIDLTYNMGAWWTIFKQAAKAAAVGDFDKFADQMQYKNPETKEPSNWYQQVGKRAVKIVGMIRKGKDNKTASIPDMIPPSLPTSEKVAGLSKENAELNTNLEKQQQTTTINNVGASPTQQPATPINQAKPDDRSPMQRKMQG